MKGGDRMRGVRVGEAMTPDPLTVRPETSVSEVANVMIDANVGGLPVVDETGGLVGIVTESDLVVQDSEVRFPRFVSFLAGYVFAPGSLHRFDEKFKKAVAATAGDVMTEEVVTIDAGDSVEDAATLMTRRKLKRLPVTRAGRLVGMITEKDIVRLISRGPAEGAG